jgi:hypothetical protein
MNLVLLGTAPSMFAADTAAPAAATQGESAAAGDGCMPGGGCCGGSANCPKAPRGDDGKVAGGCPCQKAKEAAKQAEQQPSKP